MIDGLLDISQPKESGRFRTFAPDEHDCVEVGNRGGFDAAYKRSHGVSEETLDAVAVNCPRSDTFADGNADTQYIAGRRCSVRYCRQQKRSGRHSTSRPHYVVKCMGSLQWSADHERGLTREANRDTSTTLCTTTCKDLTTVFRSHTCTETVNIDTTTTTWLIRTLHSFTPEILVDRSLENDKHMKNQLIFVTPDGNGWCCPSTWISPYWFSNFPILSARA